MQQALLSAGLPPPGAHGQYSGRVKSYNPKQGYGFLDCAEARMHYGRDVFIHKAQMGELLGRFVGPGTKLDPTTLKMRVRFCVEVNRSGMPQARDVMRVDDPADAALRREPGPLPESVGGSPVADDLLDGAFPSAPGSGTGSPDGADTLAAGGLSPSAEGRSPLVAELLEQADGEDTGDEGSRGAKIRGYKGRGGTIRILKGVTEATEPSADQASFGVGGGGGGSCSGAGEGGRGGGGSWWSVGSPPPSQGQRGFRNRGGKPSNHRWGQPMGGCGGCGVRAGDMELYPGGCDAWESQEDDFGHRGQGSTAVPGLLHWASPSAGGGGCASGAPARAGSGSGGGGPPAGAMDASRRRGFEDPTSPSPVFFRQEMHAVSLQQPPSAFPAFAAAGPAAFAPGHPPGQALSPSHGGPTSPGMGPEGLPDGQYAPQAPQQPYAAMPQFAQVFGMQDTQSSPSGPSYGAPFASPGQQPQPQQQQHQPQQGLQQQTQPTMHPYAPFVSQQAFHAQLQPPFQPDPASPQFSGQYVAFSPPPQQQYSQQYSPSPQQQPMSPQAQPGQQFATPVSPAGQESGQMVLSKPLVFALPGSDAPTPDSGSEDGDRLGVFLGPTAVMDPSLLLCAGPCSPPMGCAPAVGATSMVEQGLDGHSGQMLCYSPTGSFVEKQELSDWRSDEGPLEAPNECGIVL